jgi:hypothetical protein
LKQEKKKVDISESKMAFRPIPGLVLVMTDGDYIWIRDGGYVPIPSSLQADAHTLFSYSRRTLEREPEASPRGNRASLPNFRELAKGVNNTGLTIPMHAVSSPFPSESGVNGSPG